MNYEFFFYNIVDSLSTLKLNQQISKLLLLPLIFVGYHHQVKFQALQWHMQLHQVIQSHGPHKHHLTFCHYKLFLLLNILPSMLFPSLNVLLLCVVPTVQNYQMLLPKCCLDVLSSHTSMLTIVLDCCCQKLCHHAPQHLVLCQTTIVGCCCLDVVLMFCHCDHHTFGMLRKFEPNNNHGQL